jgi:transcriptional regulator GlxA family with amidase domain
MQAHTSEFTDEVINVGILIFDEVEILDFCGPFEVFSVAGRIKANSQPSLTQAPAFAVFTIAETAKIVKTVGNMLVQPHFTLQNHPPLDVLIVPGGWGTRQQVNNPVLIDWIAKVSGHTKLNTSVCTGSFLLAKAGLLTGYKATTHWLSLDRFEQDFPDVEVQREVRWVEQDNVLSSAGISAGIDMSLHLVERLLGRELALSTAKQMEYYWNENKR